MHLIAYFEKYNTNKILRETNGNISISNQRIYSSVVPKLKRQTLVKFALRIITQFCEAKFVRHLDPPFPSIVSWHQMTEELLVDITKRGYLIIGAIVLEVLQLFS